MIVRGVNFQEIFKKHLWLKEKQNGNKKNVLTVSCYRMPSTGKYIILFVSTVKLNLLKFWVTISCQGNTEIRDPGFDVSFIARNTAFCKSDPTHAHEVNHVIIYFVIALKFKPVSENILPANVLKKMS